MEKILLSAQNRQIAAVTDLLNRLKQFNVEPVMQWLHFNASELNADESIEKLSQKLPTISRKKNEGRRCLYVFKINASSSVLEAFENFAVSQLDEATGKQVNRISMSRRNKFASSETLYVGSSALSGLRSRFKQHCGFYKKKNRTFGLKLNKWLSETSVAIEFCYWFYERADQDIIQQMEDGLWDELQPLFGKQGKV